MAITELQKINSCALRAFRDTADRDYIHARMAYRACLIPQFHWSALHALEKYVKCILILARIERPKKDIKHEVGRGLQLLSSNGIEIRTSESANRFIKTLEQGSAKFRYLEVSWSIHEHELLFLDKAVWEIRRYCNSALYNYSGLGSKVCLKDKDLTEIKDIKERTRENTYIQGGFIEKTLENNASFAREYLVWRNFYYSSRRRETINIKGYLQLENSPFYLHPEIIDEINKYVFVPKEVINAYKKS